MASSHGADRISARRDLGDNPRLVLIAPCPPPPGAGKHLQPADWLRDSTMFSVHSKPSGQNQTADSQISTSSGRWSQNTAYGITDFVATEVSAAEGAPPAATPGFTRKILSQMDGPAPGYETLLVEATIEQGTTVARHTHPGIESAYVLEGVFEL